MKQGKRIVRSCARGIAVGVLVVAMASCGVPESRETMSPLTLEDAKTKVLTLQDEIVALVPQESVASIFVPDTSSLMNCEGGRKKWTGVGQVELRAGLDKSAYLDQVRDVVSGRDEWAVKDKTNSHGERVVDLLHDDGTHLMVSIWGDPESVQIDSFSACFDFPEYQYGEKY